MSELDTCLLAYFDLFDEYQSQRSRLSTHFSRAFLKLAEARFASGRKYGPDQYDARMKCTRRLHCMDGLWTFFASAKLQATTTLRNRKHARRTHDKAEAKERPEEVETEKRSEETGTNERDSLRWFGVLVPLQLRESQSDFSAALEDVITLANILERMNTAEQEVKRLRALHREQNRIK